MDQAVRDVQQREDKQRGHDPRFRSLMAMRLSFSPLKRKQKGMPRESS